MDKIIIPKEERLAAAKHFTLGNLALLETVGSTRNIDQAFSIANHMLETETGCSADAELRDWVKEVNKAKPNDWVCTQWQKEKSRWDL
jgi:hypothetical protein